MIPADLKYTDQHEWVKLVGDDTVRIGITHYAQQQLGDVVFVQLPEIGAVVTAGQATGEVESTKSVSDIYAPVSGQIVAVNQTVVTAPETINESPYEQGWLIEIKIDNVDSVHELLTAASYAEKIDQE